MWKTAGVRGSAGVDLVIISVTDTVNILAWAGAARPVSPAVVKFAESLDVEGGHVCCKISQTI
jgi:hypothetical protein